MMTSNIPFNKKGHWLIAPLSAFVSLYRNNPYWIMSHVFIIANIFNFNILETYIKSTNGNVIPIYLLYFTPLMISQCIFFSKLAKKLLVKNISTKRRYALAGLIGAVWIIIGVTEITYFTIDLDLAAIGYYTPQISKSISEQAFPAILIGAIGMPLIDIVAFHARGIGNWRKPYNNSKSSIFGLTHPNCLKL